MIATTIAVVATLPAVMIIEATIAAIIVAVNLVAALATTTMIDVVAMGVADVTETMLTAAGTLIATRVAADVTMATVAVVAVVAAEASVVEIDVATTTAVLKIVPMLRPLVLLAKRPLVTRTLVVATMLVMTAMLAGKLTDEIGLGCGSCLVTTKLWRLGPSRL